MNNSKKIFISYRRRASEYAALAIYYYLIQHKLDVFLDVMSMGFGEFSPEILNEIAQRDYFIIILSPETVKGFKENQDEEDWVRKELELAIDLKKTIIPLLTDEFTVKKYGEFLTGKLEILKKYHMVNIPGEFFAYAMENIRERLFRDN